MSCVVFVILVLLIIINGECMKVGKGVVGFINFVFYVYFYIFKDVVEG